MAKSIVFLSAASDLIMALLEGEYPVKPWISLVLFEKALVLISLWVEHRVQFQALMVA